MSRIAVLLLAFCFAMAVCVQADVTIPQHTFTKTLYAGSTFSENFSFTPTLKTDTYHINTTIIPDSDGINVTYSHLPTTLQKNVLYTIEMTVSTSMLLAPGNYSITTSIVVGQEPVAPPVHHTIHYVTPPPENGTNPPPYNPPPINNTNNTIPPPIVIIPEPSWLQQHWIGTLIWILIAIALLIFILMMRKRKKAHGLGYEYPAHEEGKQ